MPDEIDESALRAVARAICTAVGGQPDMTALPIFPGQGEGPELVWRKYIPEARAALIAYEAAKAGDAGGLLEMTERLPDDFTDDGNCCAGRIATPPAPAAPAGVVEDGAGSRHPQFMQGMRSAQKRAVQWLHDRAASMNDPHAKSILDSAAFSYGGECKRALALVTDAKDGERGKGLTEPATCDNLPSDHCTL